MRSGSPPHGRWACDSRPRAPPKARAAE
jgi:hypothetical protein